MASNNGESYLPIQEKDLKVHAPRASQLINKVTFKSTRRAKAQPVVPGTAGTFRESSASAGQEESESLLVLAKAMGEDAVLLTDAANHVLSVVKTGITIGFYLAGQYGSASGLDTLGQLNRQGRLPATQQPEFQAKNATAAAVATFAMASYVLWELGSYQLEKVGEVKMPEAEAPELYLVNFINAVDCSLFGLCKHLRNGLVKTDIQMVKAAILYFEAVIRELKLKEKSFAYAEFFTQVSYRLVDTEFRVKGFEEQAAALIQVNEFNRIEFDAIVGNAEAKHEARRICQRIVCFDSLAKKNPFMVIGGFPLVRMGKGSPGTGKSMQIAATATLMEGYCEQIGLPFFFHPMPQTIVSTYQGGSGERMYAWMQRGHSTNGVIYMPIDDAENNLQDRTREGVSSGVREVVSAFLTGTEGASAPRYGNSVIEIFTNLPEQIDLAVLSRVTSRFSVNGAVKWEDFLDQDRLWLVGLGDDQRFVGMSDPKGYEYLSSQGKVDSIAKLVEKIDGFTDEKLADALRKADGKYSRTDHGFFAQLFTEVQKHYPLFTSRDVRNIQTAVNVRITDFDLPEDWFEHPDKYFFNEEFGRRVEMLKELRRGCMKGLTFAEVRLQEAIRYLTTMASIANIDRERRIEAIIKDMEIREEALKRFQARK